MLAALFTTPFVPAFHPTLIYGIPFLLILTIAYLIRQKRYPEPIRKPVQETP
jgi:hypothetical protein